MQHSLYLMKPYLLIGTVISQAPFSKNSISTMEFPKLNENFLKGRGAQINPFNPFHDKNYIQEHIEGLDEEMLGDRETLFFTENAKKVVNKVDLPNRPLRHPDFPLY